jgi:hypothetical protein
MMIQHMTMSTTILSLDPNRSSCILIDENDKPLIIDHRGLWSIHPTKALPTLSTSASSLCELVATFDNLAIHEGDKSSPTNTHLQHPEPSSAYRMSSTNDIYITLTYHTKPFRSDYVVCVHHVLPLHHMVTDVIGAHIPQVLLALIFNYYGVCHPPPIYVPISVYISLYLFFSTHKEACQYVYEQQV